MKREHLTLTLMILAIGFFLFVINPTITGNIVQIENLNDALNNMDQIKNDFNRHADEAGLVASIFGNEVLNFTIERYDGSVKNLQIQTKDGKIIKVDDVEEDVTMNIWLDEETFDGILDADDQLNAIEEALDDKSITYDSLNLGTAIKATIASIMLEIRSWFT